MPLGLRFCEVDLHVHTPASRCFVEPNVTAQDIVARSLAVGMCAIAITDHNTGEWVDAVKQAAVGTGLVVFPGVEITVQPGVHVLALFPENRSGKHVSELLVTLGIGADQQGDPQALVTLFGVQKVISIIQEQGALPILAHIDAPGGVCRELSGQTLIQLWEAAEFAAVEVVGEGLPARIGKAPFEHCPAYYWASDNPHPDNPSKHSHLGIGSRYSRFKLDDPITWEGLRQCFQDPEVRIQPGHPGRGRIPEYAVIEQVKIEGGFLAGLDLEFTPNLNCLIGGRGTGKSTLLELIRYAFGIEPKTETNARQSKGLLSHTFPPGSRVNIHFKVADGAAYRIERTANQPPRVFRACEDDPLVLTPDELVPLQVYGQKEIYEISLNPAFQLRLLDNYVAEALSPLLQEEQALLRQLRANAETILQLEESIASAQEWLGRLGAIKEELARMESQHFVARIEQKELYDRESYLLTQAEQQVNDLIAALNAFPQEHQVDVSGELSEDLPNRSMLVAQWTLLQAIEHAVEHGLSVLAQQLQDKWAEGQMDRGSWRTAYNVQNEAYQEFLREFQLTGQSVTPDRYIQLKKREQELEERQREVQRQQVRVKKLYTTRYKLLRKLRRLRRQQYEIRRDKGAELSKSLGNQVEITVYPQGYREAYKDYLRDLFAGLDVRNPQRDRLADAEASKPERAAQNAVAVRGETQYLVPRIPRYRDPFYLAAAIRQEQAHLDQEKGLLETRFGIDSVPARRNMARLDQKRLFELEIFSVPDLPVIKLQVGSGKLGYRPLDELSVGQRCTALLSLVLLESPAPLLIDQPEDDLDNQFIFEQIVATLRREKEKRQFLIATHNANIPVSGDAELIIVLGANDKQGWIQEDGVGSIDSHPIKQYVEDILEGGETAFKIRKEKYGIK